MAATISTLRQTYYGVTTATAGGAEDLEDAMLVQAAAAGVTASDVIIAADYIQSNGGAITATNVFITAGFLAAATAAGVVGTDLLKSKGFPRWTAGFYYSTPGATSTVAATLGNLLLTPLWVPAGRGIDRLSCETTNAVATSITRMGVYADNGSGVPTTLLEETAAIDTATTAVFTATTTLLTNLHGGLYWVGLVNQVAQSTYRYVDSSEVLGWTSPQTFMPRCYYQASVTGALPAPFVAAAPTSVAGRVSVRAI